MYSFITGSWAYGEPRPDSDIDLVIMCGTLEADILRSASEDDASVRYGNLNLIVCDTEEEWNLWKKGTEMLAARRPVKRKEAIQLFSQLREEAGIELHY